jgi:hypothetical protein
MLIPDKKLKFHSSAHSPNRRRYQQPSAGGVDILSMTYNERLKDPKWQIKRLKIIERDGEKCRTCGKESDLQVHHTIYENGKMPWEYEDRFLVTLCDECHNETEIRITEIKWILSFMQQDRPWCMEGAKVLLHRQIEDEVLREECRTKLEELNTKRVLANV